MRRQSPRVLRGCTRYYVARVDITHDSNIQVDRHGVEVLDAEAVEERALQTIRAFDPVLVSAPRSIPVEEFVRQLAENRVLEYEPSADLGNVLGRCWFSTPRIEINRALEGPWRRFVLAHELGHFTLHRHLKVLRRDYVEDYARTIHEGAPPTPPAREWMEWQANRFAAALLAPLPTLAVVAQEALEETRLETGPRRLRQIADYIAAYFDVGKTAARRRLDEIGVLAKKWAPQQRPTPAGH